MKTSDHRVDSFLGNLRERRIRRVKRSADRVRCAVVEAMESRVLITGAPTVAAGPQFFGPLAGWLIAPAATGNAVTDTANLQNDLNLVATSGNSNTLYIPAGTYLINQSLVFRGKSEAVVIGADPATTIIQWAGPSYLTSPEAMLIDYGNTITQFNRVTLNGEGQVAIGISDGYHPSSGMSQQSALGTLGNSGASAYYGVAFTTENVVEKVNQLQLWVPANETTTQAHTLELVDASTGLVVTNGSLMIPAGRIGGTSGVWITNNLAADAVLAANHTYYLVAQEFNGGDSWYDDATAMGPDDVTVASVNGSVDNVGGSFGIITAGKHSFGPVNFNLDTAGNFFPTNDQFLYVHMLNFPTAGFDVGAIEQAAETTMEGCQFSYCGANTGNPIGSGGGLYLFGQNTIDWWIRDCEFDHDSVGIASNFGGYSMDVDNSVFNSDTLMDVFVVNNGYSSAIRNSTSIDSAQFMGGGSATGVILQNDTILDSTSTSTPPINLNGAQLTLLNSAIRNNAGYTGPDVAVANGGDILSFGNTFGVSGGGAYNPYLYRGSDILDAQGNQVLSLTSPVITGLAPQTLPGAPAVTNYPIIEVTPTGVANTDTANIKNAISAAKTDIDSGAAGVVIHLQGGHTTNNTTGSFNINSTLIIPAGYPIELVGDGAVYQSSGNSGTALSWSGLKGGTIIDLGGATLGVAAGPSCATITGMGILGGDNAGDGIRVEYADQVGGNVFSDYSTAGTDGNDTPNIYTQTGVFADGLSNTNVQLADFESDGQYSVKVVGGATPGSGGQVGVFMGSNGGSEIDQYDVSNGGKLLVEDQYLEEDTGDTNQYAHVDNGTFTLQGAVVKANAAGVDASNPPFSVSGASTVSVLSVVAAAGIILQPGSNSNLLAAGDGQWGSSSGPSGEIGPFGGPLDYAAQSQVALVANANSGDQVSAGVTNLNSFLQQMLSQTLNNRVQLLSTTPSRTVTDVRFYGVDLASCVNDVHLVGSSPTPVLSNPPTPTTPPAPTNVTATTGGSGGTQVNILFTPGGQHLVTSGSAFNLGNAHNMTLANSYTGNVGMQFTTGPAPIVVNQLGRFVVPGNSQSHLLELVQASNLSVVASATLQTSSAQANAFAYASVTSPVTLAPNTQYYLVSAETSGGDQYVAALNGGGGATTGVPVYSTSIVKSIDAAGSLSGGVWTVGNTSTTNSEFSYGPLDFVAEELPRLSGQGLTNGATLKNLGVGLGNYEGMQFTTGPNAVTVSNLGRWIAANTTTTQSHTIELIDPANGNAVLGSATLSAGKVGGANGEFQYATLGAAISLAANHSYYLVSMENTSGDPVYGNNTQMAPSGLIASIDGSVSYNGIAWTFTANSRHTYGPLDLLAAVDTSTVTYDVYRSVNPSGAGATLIASNLTTTSYIDTPGGAAGTPYYYNVTAINGSGASGTLGEASTSTGTALPNGWSDSDVGAPPTAGGAWTNNNNATSFTVQGGGSSFTQWNYDYEPIATASSFTETAYVSSFSAYGLPIGGYDEYRAALMVRNGLTGGTDQVAYVDVSSSFAEFAGTNGTSGVTAPVWLQLRAAYNSASHFYSITGWYSYDDITWLQAGTNSPTTISSFAKLYVGLAVNSYAFAGLTTATFTNVSVIDASLATPAAPTTLMAMVSGAGAVNLSWMAPTGTTNYYNVYRSTMAGAEGATPYATGVPGVSFQDANVSGGATYYYKVAAVNEGGVGAQSTEANATIAGIVTGSLFNDANNNGMRDGGESGLAGVAITLTPTGSTTGSSIIVNTASDGTYAFNAVPPGSYKITETLANGYALTAPVGGSMAVTVTAGQASSGAVFGNVLISSIILNFNMLVALSQDYNKPGTFANCDLDGNGTVDFNDLVLLSQNYNQTLPPGAYNGSGMTFASLTSSSAQATAMPAPSLTARTGVKSISPFTVTSTRVTDPLDHTKDLVTFYVRNSGTGATAGTRDLLAVDATLSSPGGLLIRTYDADGSGLLDDADFAGENATPTASYIRVGRPAFIVASTTPSARTDKYRDMQLVKSFEVAGALIGGGIVANGASGTRIAVAVVPKGNAVTIAGRLAAEKGKLVDFTYCDGPR